MDLNAIRGLFSGASKPDSAGARHRRVAARHVVDGLHSALGSVVDLSSTGMRIWSTRQPHATIGMALPLVLADGDQRISLTAKVMWIRKVEQGVGWQIGLHFTGVDAPTVQALETYVKAGYFTTDPAMRRKLYQDEPSFEKPAAPAEEPASAASSPRADIIDLYQLLGVGQGASAEEIRQVYRRLARQLHPDNCDEPDAGERFTRIAKAFAVLKNATSREQYDRLLRGEAA